MRVRGTCVSLSLVNGAAAPKEGPMAVRFCTTPFVFAHGREPRGRGSWAFSFRNPDRADWTVAEAMFVPGSLTFAEAKREFMRVARMFGVGDVIAWVCS